MNKDTSWQRSSDWYKKIVGNEGHYYHQTIVLPNTLRLLKLSPNKSILDLACGQGVLAKNLPEDIGYVGIDLATDLITEAKRSARKNQEFYTGDVSKRLPTEKRDFDAVTVILALQNIKHPFNVIRNAYQHIKSGGRLLIVLNHPAFRIPRFSGWQIDETKKQQYRRVDAYMSHQEIPISTHPGKGAASDITWSFHYPLSAYSEMLFDNGFMIEKIEEWVSGKKSTGIKRKMEDAARREFPLFMAITAIKI